jgi:hypothetical protein
MKRKTKIWQRAIDSDIFQLMFELFIATKLSVMVNAFTDRYYQCCLHVHITNDVG